MIFLAARSLEAMMAELLTFAIMAVPPALLILFLTLFIVNMVKMIKQKLKPTKTIVFGCLTGLFLLISIVEAFFVMVLSMFVASM
ncbi:MAG: hypothetical protein MJ098_02060 [Saccharofermentans sp.]|nr:hypothetical protein [Saccharofermentans sp.]